LRPVIKAFGISDAGAGTTDPYGFVHALNPRCHRIANRRRTDFPSTGLNVIAKANNQNFPSSTIPNHRSRRTAVPILAGIAIAIQFCFAYHVLSTGRPYWWILAIMAVPLLGCLLYYFIEVFPSSREYLDAGQTDPEIGEARNPDADLRRRVAELEACGSVDNRLALAAECARQQMYAEAERLCENCLIGAFHSDAAVLFRCAQATVDNRNWHKARELIARLRAAAPKMRPRELRLLEARILEGQGENDAAMLIFRELIAEYVGLEAHYRYASFLAKINQHESARHCFAELLQNSSRFRSSNKDEQRWVDAARQAVVDSPSRG